MNSNRTKYDEILSTSWNLLTMKNWKSDQELKHKMGLMNNHSNHTHKIGGGFWFREKAIHHTKSLITGRRKIEQSNGHLQQSKGITFSSIVNHCPLINQYLSSNKVITHDHIAYRFQSLETLGKGSFGRVIRAIDHKSGYPVAIKIIRNKKRFHQQAQVEVAILENLKKADHKNIHNIIHIRDHFTFRNHLCIVFDLLGSNLYDLLRKNDFRGFTIHSLKKITIKLLNCLCLLRKQGIIHCDLKPENILIGLNNPSELKVIDFGSSCFIHQKTYTYIQSRFYRAPEIILGITYGPPIDMWSLGCILPELYTDLLLMNLGKEKWDPDERITPNEALNHEWIIRENEQTKQNVTFQTLEQTNSENKQKDTIA
ncbi:dual specificity kinase [Schistosoma mansoni]|uniref:dual specificity kinase n=1 Tax=Schistosoma mansoni TaxID=6183 RepID=UPI0001A642C2|nr:dual specificity kinase [Schistosoma mansoni]|eukprot:XP_018653488.1 dual specificity kinase [Schistosoma mansoni]